MNKTVKIIVGVVVLAILAIFLVSIKPYKEKKALESNIAGKELYLNKEFELAKVQFEKAINYNDELIDAYLNLSKTELALQEHTKALETATIVLNAEPDNAEALTISGQVKLKQEVLDDALNFFNKAIDSDSTMATAYYYRGVVHANNGNLDASLADYKKAQELDELNIEYYNSSLTVRTQLEDYSGIISDYNKLLELDPTNTEAFYMRGYYKLNLDDFEGAIADFEKAIQLDSKLGKAYYYKGLAMAKTGKLSDAATNFNSAAKNGFKLDEAYYNEALSYLQSNQPKKAKIALNNSLKANPNGEKSMDALNNLGVSELMSGNFTKAVEVYTSILTKTPNNTDALFNRAAAYSELKKTNEAIIDLNQCIELNRKDANVYYLRGALLIGLNKFDDGCKDITVAIELGHPKANEIQEMYCNF